MELLDEKAVTGGVSVQYLTNTTLAQPRCAPEANWLSVQVINPTSAVAIRFLQLIKERRSCCTTVWDLRSATINALFKNDDDLVVEDRHATSVLSFFSFVTISMNFCVLYMLEIVHQSFRSLYKHEQEFHKIIRMNVLSLFFYSFVLLNFYSLRS
jgi:hypothetical protein